MTCSAFSQTTSESSDTLYSITPAQLRKTVLIFAEHDYLKLQTSNLKLQTSNLKLQIEAKDQIIRSQLSQFDTVNEIIIRKDKIIANNDAIIDSLKKQITAEQKDMRKFWYGVGAGVVVSGIAVLILK